ncbi:uncharacterized protein [Dysidea avara]|uniref:uncharacterized protein isoform X1 n=1 Tax=Dysidea avara TaxID=196820 RepID=UPI00331FA9F8
MCTTPWGDIWHKAKLPKRVLLKAGKMKGMSKIALWSPNVVNHFWHCCSACDGHKGRGVLHHVQDVHEWYQGECDHSALTEPRTNQQGAELENFKSTNADFRLIQSIIIDQHWMKSLKYYDNFRHTGMLESFHNTLLAYSPKRCAFQDEAYKSRIFWQSRTIIHT